MELYIGLMSGTSVDGIDAVLVGFDNQKLELLGTHSMDFPDDLKGDILQLLRTFNISLLQLGEIDHRLGLCYADCVTQLLAKTSVSSKEIKAIGCHGQTVFHAPDGKFPFTMQLGDANLVAAKTGITTVADFRRMDMAFHGQGAPLTPAFHQKFLNSPDEKRIILNLGGIANITILSENEENVLGFDTGPANCLLDLWIQHIKNEKFDRGGEWARSGKMNADLLNLFLSDGYFSLPAPKSTGKELFNLSWIKEKLGRFGWSPPEDVQATLLELTAVTISRAIRMYGTQANAVYLCGGGSFNAYLQERLKANLPDLKVSTTDELGLPVQWVEAVCFAWLAMRRIHNAAGNLPGVTGASRPVKLGVIYEY